MSNLIDQFDENYDGGIGLNDSIIDLIETSKVDTPQLRQVSDEAVFAVAERSLVASASLPKDVQHFNAIREVTNFLTLSAKGAVSEAVSKHRDLLPVNHPESTATHEFSISELRELRAGWIASDPRIENDSVRAIVAATYSSNPYSLEYYYNLVRLTSLADQVPSDLRLAPLVAFGDPYAGKNSFWHRKMRAEAQRRDDEGQFAEMGGGARLYVRLPAGNIISVVGKVAGIPENNPNGIDLEILDVDSIEPGVYTVPLDKVKFFKAIIPEEGVSKKSPVGPGLNVEYVEIQDLIRKDLPTSWYEDERGTTVSSLENKVAADENYATGDGYRVAMYRGTSDGLEKRVNEAKEKFGSLVVNTKGTDSLESGKPVYELVSTKRGQEEVVGYAQDWATVQALAKAEDDNYPSAENEPIEKTPEPQKPAPTPEPQKPAPTPEPQKPAPTPELTEAQPELSKEEQDDLVPIVSDPFTDTPDGWFGFTGESLKQSTPQTAISQSVYGYPNLFLKKDSRYSVVAPSPFSYWVPESLSGEDSNLDESMLQPQNFWVVQVENDSIGVATNWQDVERVIQAYEAVEEAPVVDEKQQKVARNTKVTVLNLLEDRYKLLEAENQDVIDFLEKEKDKPIYNVSYKRDKVTNEILETYDVGGYDATLGVEGVNQGVLNKPVFRAISLLGINTALLLRKGSPEAIDMWDEMMDYPQNFTVKQLATFYYNLTRLPDKSVKKDEKGKNIPVEAARPQQREKLRRAIQALTDYKVPESEYDSLKQKIDNYRLVPNADAGSFLDELNAVLAPYREDQSEFGLTFRPKVSVKGSEIIVGDIVVDREGDFVEVSEVTPAVPELDQDPSEVENRVDISVLRGGQSRYLMDVDLNDEIEVYRGTGVLPTKENLKRHEELKKTAGIQRAADESETSAVEDDVFSDEDDVFSDEDDSTNYGDRVSPKATVGKKDPSEVRNPILDRAVNALKTALSAHIVTDKAEYDRAVELVNNRQNYEFQDIASHTAKLNKFEKRPPKEFTADIELIESLRENIKTSSLSFEEKKELLKDLHTITSADAKKMAGVFKSAIGGFDRSDLEAIKNQTNIVDLINEYTPLTPKSSTTSVGLCVFHEETTPSMMVNKDEKRFYCFGCQEHGDIFNFIQKKEGLTLPQAVTKLAARIGYTPTVENLSALLIAKSKGFNSIPPESYAPYGTDLIGEEAPTPGLMQKVKQVIENYEIKPDDPSWLAWFMANHRILPKEEWQNLIETWEKVEYAKYIPRIFTNTIPLGDGGPTNRQLVSIERIWNKGFIPEEFRNYFLKSYSTAERGWFNKIGTVLKGLEDRYDYEILEYAVANLRDIKNLRKPEGYPGIPTGYQVPSVNEGYELDLEESEAFKNKYLALFPSYLRDKTEGDEFWKDLVDLVAPMAGGTSSSDTSEEDRTRAVKTIAQKVDAQKTRTRLRKLKSYAERLLDAPASEVNRAGKSVIARFVVDVDILANALKLSRKNIINKVPAEYDRRIMGIVAGLGGGRSPYSYGSIKGVNQSTRDTIDNLINLISQEVGAYRAGESEEIQIVVDEMFSSNISTPRMKRFVPPAFSGPALEPLKDMDQFNDVIKFLESKKLRVVDLETTGLVDLNNDQIKNDPIQIAVAELDNLKVTSMQSTYINPESVLSQFTLKTIGDGTGKKVTREFLESQPSKYEAMKQFLDTVPQDSILVGHNGFLFDMEVINRTLREAGLPEYQFSGFIDTYGLSHYIMPRWTPENPNAPYKLAEYPIDGKYLTPVPSDSLESLVMYFGLSNNGRHEADADVLSTAEVLSNLLQFAASGKGANGRDFDFFAARNNWSDLEYAEAEAKYRRDVEKYKSQVEMSEIGLRLKNASLVKVDPNEVIDGLIQALNSKRIDPDYNRSQPLPAPNIVSQLPSGSYVFDLASGRVGRSYGSGENGKVLVEFTAPDYLSSNKKTLELLSPASLYNMTDALVNKDGMVLDYGMSVSNAELGEGVIGHFSGFEGSGVARVTVGPSLYRLPVKDLSILKYSGTLIATKEQVQKANNLLDSIKASEILSEEFIQAIRKTLSAQAYPRESLTDLIKMLVNAENQKKLVEANKDKPEALQSSQVSATSIVVDEKKRTSKLTPKDLENVAIDDTLIKKKMPNIKLTKENKEVLKAIAAPAINKGKSKTKNRNNIIIGALAGTGKTTQLETIALQEAAMNPNRRILYTVKGKANQKQAEKRLKDVGNIKASTLNSLAFNVNANQSLVLKYSDQNQGSPFSEQLNPVFAPAAVSRHFAVQERYAESILDKHKVILSSDGSGDIVPNQLVRWAYDGLIAWMNSADREFSAAHFNLFRQHLESTPPWSPGGAGYEPVHSGSKPSNSGSGTPSIEDSQVVLKNGQVRFGKIVGPRYVYRNEAGRITAALTPTEYESRKNRQKQAGEGATNYDNYTLEDIVSYEPDRLANEGFFIDDLIDLAQAFWDNITSPLIPDTLNVSLPVTQDVLVKNWALGNVDITAVDVDDNGRRTSIQGLQDIPDMWQIDEAQDLSPVFIDILLRQQFSYDNGVQIVIVGDVNQAIFKFAKAENAMAEGTLPDSLIDGVAGLTQNYRSEPEVLAPANNVLGVLGSKSKLVAAKKATGKGIIHEPKTLVKKGMAAITRTNAGILDAAVELSREVSSEVSSTETFGKGAVFAIQKNLKLRLRDTLLGLRYLERISSLNKDIKNSTATVDMARQALNVANAELEKAQDSKERREEAIAFAQEEVAKALTAFNAENDRLIFSEKMLKDLVKKGMPKKAPYILRGTDVTYESVEMLAKDQSGNNGSLDAADVMLIVKLAKRMEFVKDSEGKSQRVMYRNEALQGLYELAMRMRLVDEDENFKMPTFVGQAGSLGGEVGYRVVDNNLVIEDAKGAFTLDSSDLLGVFANRYILQSIGFEQERAQWEIDGLTRAEARDRYREENPELDENDLEKMLYRPMRWLKELELPEDDMYVEEQVQAVFDALTGADASATLVTGHTAKGLEYKSIRGWNDWDPAYYMEKEQEDVQAKREAEAKKKPKTPEELEKQQAEDERFEEEKEQARREAFDRTEINLIYVMTTRAMEEIDLGPLHNYLMTESGIKKLSDALAMHEPDDSKPPVVDEMYSTSNQSQGEYYDKINESMMNQKQVYLEFLRKSLKEPVMQRITPFRFATDADIKQAEQETRDEIAEIIINPGKLKKRDQNNRMGLLEILDMIRRGGGASALSETDRQRLYTYLGSSSLGSQSALDVDPTQKIEEAVEELNKRLGID